MVLGHESSGVVVEVGEGVTHLKPGDRVALEPGVPCRMCQHCKTGHYNLCPEMEFAATPPYHGTLTEYYTHPADFCFKLPDNVSYAEGALMEPFSVAIHACRRAGVTLGSSVLICGSGPIGLVNVLAAKAAGATFICVYDINGGRLEVAKELGAHHTVIIDPKKSPEETAQDICNQSGFPLGFDISIECSGAESSMRTGIFATKPGGKMTMVGLGHPDVSLPVVDGSIVREVELRGSFRYCNTYPTAIQLASSGLVNLKPLLTHHFKFEDSIKAFELVHSNAPGVIKVQIWNGDENTRL
ncbi:hypothetical protein K7432_013715 [Basidiobolus ranarum]|uniref:Sorbitol dehydrogenase n=1 Tax=Basidiobolus ranarum TaxID=34480 RepID=A0ABR2WIS3_9FUNG